MTALLLSILAAHASAVDPILVRLTPGTDAEVFAEGLDEALQGTTFETLAVLPASGVVAVQADAAARAQLRSMPDVKGLQADRPVPPVGLTEWYQVGADRAYRGGARGNGTVVAVFDTGIDMDHPMLDNQVVAGVCFSTTVRGQATSVCDPDLDGTRESGGVTKGGSHGYEHGTEVAGVVLSMAPRTQLVSVQVFSEFTAEECAVYGYDDACLLAWTHDILAGLEWLLYAAEGRPVVAANLSLGGGSYGSCPDSVYAPVIGDLRAAGIGVVAAAGNSGDVGGISAPACVPAAIAVGAVDSDDQVAWFSQAGVALDILAPGVSVESTAPGGEYVFVSGTSFASPHVAGALATMAAIAPGATVDELERVLLDTGPLLDDDRTGSVWPRLQLDDAVEFLLE